MIDASDLFIIEYGDKSIEIKNHFFSNEDIQALYTKQNIPSKIEDTHLAIGGKQFPIISMFGTSKIEVVDGSFILDSDIISSSFYMLSRWEEFAIQDKDAHGRFSSKSSLADRFHFLERPIVNEYVEIIWALLQEIGIETDRRKYQYTIVPTHDVDIPYMWWSLKQKAKSFAAKIYGRRTNEFRNNLKHLFQGSDPYDTHGLFMNLSEKANVKSHFFFMTGGQTMYDNRYKITHPRILKLIENVKEKEHCVGLHPSYDSYTSPEMLREEKGKLEDASKLTIDTGRHHYLRFDLPTTWKHWNDIGMKWDSTMSFADQSGFRCGVCYPFPTYDIVERVKLDLYERPLIVMEASVAIYENLSLTKAIDKVRKLKNQVKKYNGEFVFLWHNSSLNDEKWLPYEPLLYELYNV